MGREGEGMGWIGMDFGFWVEKGIEGGRGQEEAYYRNSTVLPNHKTIASLSSENTVLFRSFVFLFSLFILESHFMQHRLDVIA